MPNRYPIENCCWWGWGDRTTAAAKRKQYAYFTHYVTHALGCHEVASPVTPSLTAIELPPPILKASSLNTLRRVIKVGTLSSAKLDRCLHSLGKSYGDLIALRQGHISNPPDAVFYPGNVAELRIFINVANDLGVALVPYGGGTSVQGGIGGPADRPFITVDLRLLNHLLELSASSRLATFESGITGPSIESHLQERGFTLGHFPNSFEYSTLGGWVATRSTGHHSQQGGRIESLVKGLQMEIAGGTLTAETAPVMAMSPNLCELAIGSCGGLGIISQVTVSIHPLPETEGWQSWYVPRFADAVQILYELVSRGICPSSVHLCDPNGTRLIFEAQREQCTGVLSWLSHTILAAKTKSEASALLIVSFEGALSVAESRLTHAKTVFKRYGSVELGVDVAKSWDDNRFREPYVRDSLLEAHVLATAVDFTTSWPNILNIHERLNQAFTEMLGPASIVSTSITSVHSNGVTMSLTVLTRQEEGYETEQWQEIMHSANRIIAENGGHAVQRDLVSHNAASGHSNGLGDVGLRTLKAIKTALDPKDIFNPGKYVVS